MEEYNEGQCTSKGLTGGLEEAWHNPHDPDISLMTLQTIVAVNIL